MHFSPRCFSSPFPCFRKPTNNQINQQTNTQVGSIIAAMSLSDGSIQTIMLPFWICGAGTLASMIGFFVVGMGGGTAGSPPTQKQLMRSLNRGIWVTSVVAVLLFGIVVHYIFEGHQTFARNILACICIGLFAGIAIGWVSQKKSMIHCFIIWFFGAVTTVTDLSVP